jgi:hypothetical protein
MANIRFGQPHYCEGIAVVHPGNFVHFIHVELGETKKNVFLGQYVGRSYQDKMMIRRYMRIEETSFSKRCLRITEGFGKGLPKVVRFDGRLFDCAKGDVTEFAWVFHPVDLEAYSIVVPGVKSFYVCQFNEEQKAIRMLPFPRCFPRSAPEILLQDLERTRDNMVAVLNRISEHGEVASILRHASCGDLFWSFLKRQVEATTLYWYFLLKETSHVYVSMWTSSALLYI